MIILAEQFRHGTGNHNRNSEWLRQQRWFFKARHDKAKREEITEQIEDDNLSLATSLLMASDVQVQKFEAKLDMYDEATVKALMENQEQIDVVNARLEDMLGRAFVLDDGRRIFLTEDSIQAFDEHGAEVGSNELDFDLVPQRNPTWENFSVASEQKQDLEAQRSDLFKFQHKLDGARERLSEGEISETELNDLNNDLENAMPASVKVHLSGAAPPSPAPSLSERFAASSTSPAPRILSPVAAHLPTFSP